MNIRSFSRCAPWMTNAEWRQALRHRRALLKDFAERGVALNVFLCLRLHDYLVTLVLTQRAENFLLLPSAEDGAPLPMPTPEEFAAIIARREKLAQLLAEVENGPQSAAPQPADEPQPSTHEVVPPANVGIPMPTLPQVNEGGYPLNRRQRRALARLGA